MKQPTLSFIPFAFPNVPHVRCAFQVRNVLSCDGDDLADNVAINAGNLEQTLANRKALAPLLGIEAWAEMHQVHGSEMYFEPQANDPECSPNIDADGLATTRPNFGLMIKSADCQPVFLASPDGRHLAALHVGWRGNNINFPGKAVRNFCERYKLSARNLYAVRGPSLGRGAAEFEDVESTWGGAYMPWYNRTSKTMDLWGITQAQLVDVGVLPERIFSLDLCTLTLSNWFYSHRAGHAGRLASIAWIGE